jgi:hypothetical protein
MKKVTVLLGLSVLFSLSGCSTYRLVKAITSDEPVGTSVAISKQDRDDFNKRNGFDKPAPAQPVGGDTAVAGKSDLATKAAKEAGKYLVDSAADVVFSDGRGAAGRVKMVAIGDTKTLMEATPEQVNKAYDYVVAGRAKAGTPLLMTREWYMSNLAAATTVRIVDSVWTKNVAVHAAVSTSMKKLVQFAASGGLLAETGDLVLVEAFEDRGTWITRVLCKKSSPDFEACAGKYARGMFQATDGREIGIDYKLVANGKQIDLATFEKVASAK